MENIMRKQVVNPYLPSWEYIPDGEPYVFNGRVYIYGSHDCFNGHVFCMNDYVCWSAPEDDLSDWRYEGVIYKKTNDPLNLDGEMCLYAPDVTVGPDGRYYLYYVFNTLPIVSVAVCDTPAGEYQFYGYVHDKKGDRLGERPGDEAQFDPGVLTEDGKTYLYTGFCSRDDFHRSGPMVTVLDRDMLTILEEPVFIAPSAPYSKGWSSVKKKDNLNSNFFMNKLYCRSCLKIMWRYHVAKTMKSGSIIECINVFKYQFMGMFKMLNHKTIKPFSLY